MQYPCKEDCHVINKKCPNAADQQVIELQCRADSDQRLCKGRGQRPLACLKATAVQELASNSLPQEVRNGCNKYGALLLKLPTR